MDPEPTEATLDELEKKLADEEELYSEFLAKLDRLSTNPSLYERDSRLPELLSELNRPEPVGGEGASEPIRGLKGFARGMVRKLLAPDLARIDREISRQRQFDSTLVQFLNRLAEGANSGAARGAEFASALVGFAQRIDCLTDAKDRLYALLGNRRSDLLLEAMDKRLETVRLGIARAHERLEGMSSSLALARAEMAVRAGQEAPPVNRERLEQARYVAFEDRYRGSPDDIRVKLAGYVAYFEGRGPVLDLGCGRGEFLDLLRTANVEARGVDGNSDMVRLCVERGLRAEVGDVIDYVARRPSGSVGGIFAAQLIEHLPPKEIGTFLEGCHRALRPGGSIVLETVNPRSLVALVEAFFRDLTHEKPLHPETLDFALRAAGFREVEIRYSSPVSERARLLPVRNGASDARTLNHNFEKLNAFLFGDQDYAAVATK
ncbi:MAG: class I SAM-dependent methyltransferase [Vicinamibacteria bacterium]